VTRPRPCTGCRTKPVATTRHAHCYGCLPGGPHTPPPCRRCRSRLDYYTAGLCARCHRSGPPLPGSCLDCLCWGVTRHQGWLCEGCRGWRRRFTVTAECPSCRRVLALGGEGCCRLCWRQTAMLRDAAPRQPISVAAANRHGQQLFLAGQFWHAHRFPAQPGPGADAPSGLPAPHRQLVLFDAPDRDLRAATATRHLPAPDAELAALLDRVAVEHATAHGWSKTRRNAARAGLRVLAACQDTPGAPLKASHAAHLAGIGVNIQPVLEILTAAGMLHDDRPRPLDLWFTPQTSDLPEPMAGEVRAWFEILRDGSSTPPRSRPRATGTIRLRVREAMPVLHGWAAAGHHSLRGITREHVKAALPAAGTARALTGSALRSLFTVLKARKVVFANPTTRIRTGRPTTRQPLPANLTHLQAALSRDRPARAALAALIAYHAPRSGQLRALQLTDIRDGRLHLPGHTALLAEPVKQRLTAWLDHRAERWPATLNPHLFINTHTAVRTGPVSHHWINQTLGMSGQAVREDRILYEAITSGGDIRRICDLFGLSVAGAQRYTDTVDEHFSSPTPDLS
jgi:hypothetical protein